MSDAYVVQTEKLAFPALYSPTVIGDDRYERAKFRISAILSKEQAEALPIWAKPFIKAANWRNAPTGKSVMNLSSMFRVPVYGLPDGWVADCQNKNIDPDRVLSLSGVPGRIMVSRSVGSDREFVNLIAVHVDGPAHVPPFEAWPKLLGVFGS